MSGSETLRSTVAEAVPVGEPSDEPEWRYWRHPPQDPNVRMFEAEWRERCSRVHPLVPHAIYVPVIAVMLWMAAAAGLGAGAIVGLFLLGLFFWTAVEFVIHRYVFHEIATQEMQHRVKLKVHRLGPDEPVLSHLDGWREKFYFVAHGVHHEFPSDPKRLVMPPTVSVPLGVLFYLVFRFTLGATITPPFFAGFLLGYLVYDSFHYAVHFIRPGGRLEALMYRLGKGHMRHHFSDNRGDFGVSSPLWDLIVGTFDWRDRSQFRTRRSSGRKAAD